VRGLILVARRWEAALGPVHRDAGLYLFAGLLLVAGVVTGALAVRVMAPAERAALVGDVRAVAAGLASGAAIPGRTVLGWALANNMRVAGLLWLLGATVVGIPAVLVVLFLRGFAIGFTAGLLARELGAAGVVLASLTMVPSSLLALPALVGLGASALSFSLFLIRRGSHSRLPRELLRYTLFSCAMAILLLLASLIESYLAPAFIRLLGPVLG